MQMTHKSQPAESHHGAAPPEILLQALGAPPPEIILKSLNVSLTNNHMKLGNPYAYSFTKALKRDLQEIFQLQHAHGLFLCEIGSQKPYECIDKVFHERCIAAASGDYIKPKHAQDVNFVDTSSTLRMYLQETLKACKLEYLQIHSLPHMPILEIQIYLSCHHLSSSVRCLATRSAAQ